jgi:hypothetical protein
MAITNNIGDVSTVRRSRASLWAHVLERTGLAMMGASCGLFVAAHIASSAFETAGTLGFIFAMTIYGSVGGYLGIDMPSRAALARQACAASDRPAPKADPGELLSAIGTFLAALTAMISVYIIVFDETPGWKWTLLIGGVWLLGVTMQVAAGLIARLRKTDEAGG